MFAGLRCSSACNPCKVINELLANSSFLILNLQAIEKGIRQRLAIFSVVLLTATQLTAVLLSLEFARILIL